MADQLALFIDFENVAIWADEHFFDLDLTRLMEYLQSRGPVVIKRAYGDWRRFGKYRNDMLNNAIDLIQLYSVRVGKNRADIRLALDAFEVALIRPQIETIVIMSGDSDFGPLASKLREYGKYVLGIGPREITHPLLVRSCDEFLYLETVMGQSLETIDTSASDRDQARKLLRNALAVFGRKGELPVSASQLKATMLSIDSTFNEANLGFGQFRAWLESSRDMIRLYFRGMEMFVAPADFKVPEGFAALGQGDPRENGTPPASSQTSLSDLYAGIFSNAVAAEMDVRRDVLRDLYRELNDRPGEWTPGDLLAELQDRYDSQGLARSKTLLMRIWQMGFYQRAYDYLGPPSFSTRVKLAPEIDSQSAFIRRAESRFIYAVVEAGLEIDQAELASLLLHDRNQADYIQELLNDLVERGRIVVTEGRYRPAGRSENPLLDNPDLAGIVQELREVKLPDGLVRDVSQARDLAKSGMAKRTEDFSASAQDYLYACRLQWDAFEQGDPEATLEDLRWYLASYASVKAGELSQSLHRYDEARQYYWAFFSLVQEGTPLWDRMRGLVNPMLHYYWRNLARELNIEVRFTSSPINIAAEIAGHGDKALRQKWADVTRKLAQINPDLLKRVTNQIVLNWEDSPDHMTVAAQIEEMLKEE